MKKIAIVYVAHDGFTSLYTGVGTVARDFLLSFHDVCHKLKEDYEKIHFSLFATTIKYNNTCFGYSNVIKNVTELYTRKYRNIHLVELINGSGGAKSYGSINLWRNACISTATFIYSLLTRDDYDKIIVICVDTPFAQTANYFFDLYKYTNVNFVWLPQSTALIHKIDSALGKSFQQRSYINERFKWEKASIDLSKNNTQVKIGYVGNFMRRHLVQSYSAHEDTLISLQNGLHFKRLKDNILDQNKITPMLKTMGVPLNRPLLFSFGRAEPYKGLDLVLKNSAYLIKKLNYFVLILASSYSMEDPYVSVVNKLSEKYPRDIKVIYALDFLTPHYIMQWKNTRILAILSRAEPFGLIPIESRFYNNKNLSLIVSDLDGLQEQITEGVDGFKTKLDDKAIRLKLEEVAKLSAEKKGKIAENGYNRVIKEYDQIKINSKFIKQYIMPQYTV